MRPAQPLQITDYFLSAPFPSAPRYVGTKFSASIPRTDCVRPMLSRIERLKSGLG